MLRSFTIYIYIYIYTSHVNTYESGIQIFFIIEWVWICHYKISMSLVDMLLIIYFIDIYLLYVIVMT